MSAPRRMLVLGCTMGGGEVQSAVVRGVLAWRGSRRRRRRSMDSSLDGGCGAASTVDETAAVVSAADQDALVERIWGNSKHFQPLLFAVLSSTRHKHQHQHCGAKRWRGGPGRDGSDGRKQEGSSAT